MRLKSCIFPRPSSPRCQAAHIAATALCVMTLSSTLASCGTTSRNSRRPPRSPGFAVLNNAPTPDDAIPAEIAAALARNDPPGFDSADIRAARRVLANDPAWLLPATNGEICLERIIYPLIGEVDGVMLQPTRSQTCTSETEAQEGRLVEAQALLTSGTQAKDSKVVGITPNGVATVTIVLRNGRHVPVTVLQNAYEAVVAHPASVRFITRHDGKLEKHSIPLTSFYSRSPSPQPG